MADRDTVDFDKFRTGSAPELEPVRGDGGLLDGDCLAPIPTEQEIKDTHKRFRRAMRFEGQGAKEAREAFLGGPPVFGDPFDYD